VFSEPKVCCKNENKENKECERGGVGLLRGLRRLG